MNTEEAYQTMQEANRIIEDFPLGKYVFYIAVFSVEIALCIWLALKL